MLARATGYRNPDDFFLLAGIELAGPSRRRSIELQAEQMRLRRASRRWRSEGQVDVHRADDAVGAGQQAQRNEQRPAPPEEPQNEKQLEAFQGPCAAGAIGAIWRSVAGGNLITIARINAEAKIRRDDGRA